MPVFVSGTWILDSDLSWDSGFFELYSRFQSPEFQIPQAKISRIAESGFPYVCEIWHQHVQLNGIAASEFEYD